MNLILLEPDEIGSDGAARLSGPRADHAMRVLRVNRGDTVRVGVIDGALGEGRVTAVHADEVELRCTLTERPQRPRVDLLLALPRPKVLRRLWAQIASLGVGRIVLTNAARVERNYFDTHLLDPQVYRPLLVEGLQQARDTHLPLVSIHRRFKPLLEDELDALCPQSVRLVAEWELPNDYALGVMPGLVHESDDGGRRYTAGIVGVVVGKAWTPRFRTFAEVALPQIARGDDGGTVALLDLGGAWLLSDDVQLDAAYSAGLNRRSPDHGVTLGLSARF